MLSICDVIVSQKQKWRKKVTLLWAGQKFYSLSFPLCGKYILSRSFPTDSNIKNPSKLHKNGEPGNKKRLVQSGGFALVA